MKLCLKLFSVLLAAAWCLTGCTNDNLPTDGPGGGSTPDYSGKVVYISAGVALPSESTRSATDEDDPSGKDNDLTNSDEDKKDEPNDDFEYGYDYENDVRTMILVAANPNDHGYLFHTVITEIAAEPNTSEPFSFYVDGEIKYEDLVKAYESDLLKDAKSATPVNIFVYCNYTGRILDYFNEGITVGDTNWINGIGEVEENASPAGQSPAISNTIWAPRSFLMTNAQIFTTKLPATVDDWDDFADKSHPYLLTNEKHVVADNSDTNYDDVKGDFEDDSAIRVERAAARLDFRDGSSNKDNTYHLTIDAQRIITKRTLVDGEVQEETESWEKKDQNLFSIQLTRMALVNMSKHFYYFRRVSADGLNSWDILGRERGGTNANYVVDTDYEWKNKGNTYDENTSADAADQYTAKNAKESGAANAQGFRYRGFNFPLYNADNSYNKEGWYTDAIGDVLDGKNDTWSGSTSNPYKIWRYVTENTIPGALNQTTVQSTGIVFKGAIIPGTHFRSGFYVEENATVDLVEPYLTKNVQKALWAAKHHAVYDKDYNNDDATWATEGEAEWGIPEKYNYPILYCFEGMLYGDVDEVVIGAALDGHNGSLYNAVTSILSQWKLTGNKYAWNGTDNVDGLTVDTYYAKLNHDAALATALEKAKAEAEAAGSAEDFKDADFKTQFDEDYSKLYPNWDKEVDWETGVVNKELFTNKFMELATTKNITIYKASTEGDPEGWGYYCYYFYWNRHNDNNKSGEMGPMEFATVRNNVYKLSVSKINAFGHPRITEYDPDPEKPWDPDEPRLRYIQLQVEVLPWVVRVNDIEF